MKNSVFVVYMNVYLICLCNQKIVDETLPVYLSTGAQKCGYMTTDHISNTVYYATV